MEDDVGETGAIRAAVRAAKKSFKPVKIGEPDRRASSKADKKKASKKKGAASASSGKRKGNFDKEMGPRPVREGVRAKKSDIIGGMGKKKGGKRKGK